VKGLFQKCPSCSSDEVELRTLADQRTQEVCSLCSFAADYVWFTCEHCNPETFALCPRKNCRNPGKPTNNLCSPGKSIVGKIKAIPVGYHTLNPLLVVRDALSALSFYKHVFDAEEILRIPITAEKLMQANLKVGDSVLMVAQEFPEWGLQSPLVEGGGPSGIYLYVKDVDVAFKRAIKAGSAGLAPPTDAFWGDRYGRIRDPFGHNWGIATHREDVPRDEIIRRAANFFDKIAGGT
jgi:PhnB protein